MISPSLVRRSPAVLAWAYRSQCFTLEKPWSMGFRFGEWDGGTSAWPLRPQQPDARPRLRDSQDRRAPPRRQVSAWARGSARPRPGRVSHLAPLMVWMALPAYRAGLLLCVCPLRRSQGQTVLRETGVPRSASSAATRCSATCGSDAIRDSSQSRSAPIRDRWPVRRATGDTDAVSRKRRTHCIADDADTQTAPQPRDNSSHSRPPQPRGCEDHRNMLAPSKPTHLTAVRGKQLTIPATIETL